MAESISTSVDPVEQWRPVVGYEGYYSVSDQGRVRRECRVEGRGWGRNTHPGRILKPSIGTRGRLVVVLYKRGTKRRIAFTYTLVAEAFIGPRPPGLEINHINGHLDNRACALEYVTRLENMRADWITGRRKRGLLAGSKNPASKLLEPEVIDIKARLRRGESLISIARRYGVKYQAISHIRDGRNWPHIKLPEDSLKTLQDP